MARDTYQLSGDAAAIYEEQKVPSIFAPLAHAMLDRISVAQDERILDVACGTGIVGRTVFDRFSPVARIAGIDLNEAMIEHARAITKDLRGQLEWHVGDVGQLPFDDCDFTLVICQQGLQFFPDKEAALSEMARVSEPGGYLAMTIWAGASPFFTAVARSLERHVSKEVALQSLGPFSYDGARDLPDMLKRAGYSDIEFEKITIDRVIRIPERDIPKEIMGNPIGGPVKARGEGVMRAIVEDVIAECEEFRKGGALVVPQHATLITAKAA